VGRRATNRLSSLVIAVGLPIVFVVMLVDRAWVGAAIVAGAGLLLGLLYLSTWKIMRDVDKLVGDSPDDAGEPTEVMLAVDAFDDAIHDAFDVPFTDQVRLDRGKVDRLVERLRLALPPGSSTLSELFSELDELIRNSRTIPLTGQIRLDRDEVYGILDRMRASFAEER